MVVTTAYYPGLDVLVNNAGIEGSGALADLTTEEAQRVMNFNFMMPFILTREALPHLRKTKGNVIFISSCGGACCFAFMCKKKVTVDESFLCTYIGQHPFPLVGVYCPSKAALNSMAKVMALEEAPNGVRVNIISPGGIYTEMSERVFSHTKRLGTGLLFLCSWPFLVSACK